MAEKTVNEISREARLLFTKVPLLSSRENTDYAISLFNQVLEGADVLRLPQGIARGAVPEGGGRRHRVREKMISGAGSSPQL